MALSAQTYQGDGINTDFVLDFTLGYISTAHIYVYVDEVEIPQNTLQFILGGGSVRLPSPPADGAKVLVRRIVPNDALIHDYENGALVIEKNLDESNLQAVMLQHQAQDGFSTDEGRAGDLNMGTYKLVNMGQGTEPTDGVTLEQAQEIAAQAAGSGVVPQVQPRQQGDGTTTTFSTPATTQQLAQSFFINLDGISQRPYTDYTVNPDGTVTFDEAPVNGVDIDITLFEPVSLGDVVTESDLEEYVSSTPFTDVRAPTYLSTLSQAQMGGELPLSLFLPTDNNVLEGIYNYTSTEDLSPYFRDAVEAFSNRGTILVPSGLYNLNEIDVEEKALQFVSSGRMATVFQLNGGSYLWKQINCSRKTTGQSHFWVKEQANGAGLSGVVLSGNSRSFDGASGLVYEGLNDDVLLTNVDFYGFKGTALDLGDPNDPTTGMQAVRESFFKRNHIKNCGTGLLPAMRIGRSVTAMEDTHNNLHFEDLSLVYSYGFALDIVNERLGGFNNAMRKFTFKNAFLHGNALLPATDYNGESTDTQTESLVRIGGGAGFITDCKFIDSVVIDNQDGKVGINVLDRASVEWDGGNPGGGNNRTGLRYSNARQGALRNITTDDGASVTNVLDVETMAGNSKVTVDGWSFLSDGSSPNNTVTPLTNLKYINDLNMQFLTYELAAQADPMETLGGTPLRIIEKDCNIVKAVLTVNDAVTGNDSDYASIVLRVFDENGALVDAATTTTQFTGGVGNVAAKTSAVLTLPAQTLVRPLWTLQFSISKSGAGVALPASTITIETSPNIVR